VRRASVHGTKDRNEKRMPAGYTPARSYAKLTVPSKHRAVSTAPTKEDIS